MSRFSSRSVPRNPREALDALVGATSRRITVDLRALATLRITLALIVFSDLLLRARSMRAFYTDDGVLPSSLLNDPLTRPYSIHALWGSLEAQMVLFAIAGVFAVMLLVGYRTRLATAVTWFLLLSLQTRNPYVLNSGDVLLRMLLFWGMFLPLGERWSLDARRVDRDRVVLATLGTAGLLVQAALVYGVNAIHKLRSDDWVYGNAAGTVMHLDQFTILLGPYLAEFPELMKVATVFWTVLLVAAPLLLLTTGWRRALLATAFAGVHAGMILTMQLGIFPYVSIASMIAFYPPFVWDRLEDAVADRRPIRRLGDLLDWLHRRDPLARLSARVRAIDMPEWPSPVQVTSTVVPLVFIPLIVISGVASVGYAETPDQGEELLSHTQMDQRWNMFAPNPLSITRHVVARGNTTEGELVSPFPGARSSWDRPPNSADTMRNERWRKYIQWVSGETPTNYPDYFGRYLCEEWNRNHDTDLANVSLWIVHQRVTPDGPVGEPERDVVVSEYDCSGDLIQA